MTGSITLSDVAERALGWPSPAAAVTGRAVSGGHPEALEEAEAAALNILTK